MNEGAPRTEEQGNSLENPSLELVNKLKDEIWAQLDPIRTKIENATLKEELTTLANTHESELDEIMKKLEPLEELVDQSTKEILSYGVNSTKLEAAVYAITTLQTQGKLEGDYSSLLDNLNKTKKTIDTDNYIIMTIRSLDTETERTWFKIKDRLKEFDK